MQNRDFRRAASSTAYAIVAAALAAVSVARPLAAQDLTGRCTTPDSIAVRGNSRIADQKIRTEAGLSAGSPLNFPTIQRAIKALYALNEFDDVDVRCDLESVTGKALVVIAVTERLLLGDLKVTGPKYLSEHSVRDKVDLLIGRPIDPLQVARARARIDSLYESAGYYLARVVVDSTVMSDGRIAIGYRVDEGRRLAISGIDVLGNAKVSDVMIVREMKTHPEGFWWFRKGEYNDDKYVGDLGERIPALYARLGYVDMRITKDTMVVDRDRGKGLVEITVEEGPLYRIGSFEISGNRRFSSEELKRIYAIEGTDATLSQRMKGLVKREAAAPKGIFDQKKWDDAVEKVNSEYRNYGYLYARINPVVERHIGADSVPFVNLRWEIDEKNPAIVNRIEIVGNDYTVDDCIRRQINLVPGGVFNQQVLVRSYQSISNLNFFEAPIAFPDYRPINDQGDVDIIFRVKEKRTGSINFGASMGQGGVGFGGFIGVEQPNLLGLCKQGKLNWQYGRYYNDFTATYTDPALGGSRVSGALSAYRTQSRFIVGNLGQNIRTGSLVRFGLPVPWSLFSTFAVSYNAEAIQYTSSTASAYQTGCTSNCFRSNIGLEFTYDTRIDMPFASEGALRSVTVDLSGGPLGGMVNFQRVTGEFRAYAPLGTVGGRAGGGQPLKFVMGLTARSGALFGNSGPFFFQQQFAVGGVQYGQSLRGYPEFSITPKGFNPTTDQYRSDPSSFGNAFVTITGEIGLRVNQMFYVNAFTDAGNNWASPKQINPTRLYRSAGFGVSTVTPLGPLGLDMAYGFDRVAINPVTLRARPDPRWQFHFRLGQLF